MLRFVGLSMVVNRLPMYNGEQLPNSNEPTIADASERFLDQTTVHSQKNCTLEIMLDVPADF